MSGGLFSRIIFISVGSNSFEQNKMRINSHLRPPVTANSFARKPSVTTNSFVGKQPANKFAFTASRSGGLIRTLPYLIKEKKQCP